MGLRVENTSLLRRVNAALGENTQLREELAAAHAELTALKGKDEEAPAPADEPEAPTPMTH